MALERLREALAMRGQAEHELQGALRQIDSVADMRQAVELCFDAGMSAIDIARLAGISRQRVYQLKNGE